MNQTDRDGSLPGVIDTIGLGYGALAVRPLVIVPLVLIDLYLLHGPRVLLAPVTSDLARSARQRSDGWDDIGRDVERLGNFNIFEILALGAPLVRIPAIVPTFSSGQIERLGVGPTFSTAPDWSVVVLMLTSLVIAFLLASGFRILLAASGADIGRILDSIQPRLVGKLSLNSVGWLLLMAGLSLLVAMPVIVGTVIGVMFGFNAIGVIWFLLLIPVAWAAIHFYFAIPAVFVDRSGPLAAVKSSYHVVHSYFWQSVRFIVVSLIITTGLTYLLQGLAINHPGALLAVIINAFLSSGMIIAAMLFYRDRARHLGLPGNVSER